MVMPIFEHDEAPTPLIYLACRLTHLTHDQRQLLDSWCTHVEQAVAEACAQSESPWPISVHTPFTWSAPWSDRRPENQVHDANATTVQRCAALIVLAIDGGGLGVGQELTWAAALRLPVLLLHPAETTPSRQALGTPADITVAPFTDAAGLAEAVRAFLRKNRPTIEDWRRRRGSLDTALLPLREHLAEAWHARTETEQDRIEAESRVHRRRIQQLIAGDHALAGASMSEVLSLVGALGIDAANVLSNPTMPDLSAGQRAALAAASDEYEWGGADALQLERRARLELARGGTRRLSLASPADWVAFRRRLEDS
ncbi:MAG: hypothetical protein AAGD18_17420 [Actinomycetota bacterium]